MWEDQVIGRHNPCPDLVVRKENDIGKWQTVPCDNGLDAFQEARRIKVDKYKELAEELTTERVKAVVDAVAVRALESWDPANDKPLRRICENKYLETMKK